MLSLAQWAAGVSSNEDMLNIIRMGLVEGVLRRRCALGADNAQKPHGARTFILPEWGGLSSRVTLLQDFRS